jgi:hypothetical protein
MNKINFPRVLLGGLVAGLVMNIGEFVVNDLILGAQMKAFFARLNLPEPGGSFIAVAVILTFVMGVVLVWLYAAMRPRCGPGPKTAICAGVIGWLFACVYCGIINGMFLQVPMNMMVIVIVWCFFEYTVAAIAGAWLYKEA